MKPKHPRTRRYLDSGIYDGLTSFSELERRIIDLPETERGDAFEVFAEAYLATQRINQAKEIWPESELPPRLVKKFNLGKRKGVGVDGVYETTSGEWYAYQVKYRSNQNLTFNEVSPFYGITEAFDQRVLITNCNRLASQIDDRPNAFCVRGNDLARLERSDFEAMLQWLQSAAVEAERKTPDPHQQEALDTILPALTENDRISAIMACGTGKTLVTLWAAEKQGCKTLLVLVPSLALIRQTLHEWLAETKWSKLAYLCVCSDPSVQKGSDEIVIRPSELDFPVRTDSKNVAEFLSRPFDGVKVMFSTYQSAQVVADGMDDGFSFDLAIFDEAHKTAGTQGKKNSLALDDANLPICKRLFVTATPRHYSPTKRTKEGEQAILYSMDDPSVYGPSDKRFELSFADAARRKIICDYKIVISEITYEAVTNELLRRGEVIIEGDSVRARQVANQLAIKQAIEKYGIKKIFSFHGRVRSAESFTSDRSEGINSIIPALPAFHVNGKMKAADRDSVMDEFAAADSGIVSNARCLTEGVDVPAVDMVAFMSPKKSKIDIVQATGRAMRRPRDKTDKKIGYVFIPLYIEQAKEETIEEAIKRLDFEELADVLNALKEQDEILVDILREMREERGRIGGYDDSRFREKIEFIGESVALDVLRVSITTMCVDRLGVTWDERYGELVAFKHEHGHGIVPREHIHYPHLGGWCIKQRTLEKRGALSDNRIARLLSIGFHFDPRTAMWEENFRKLSAYKEEHGDCDVPSRYKSDPQLGAWCSTLRSFKARRQLSDDKIARLLSIGFDFDPFPNRWEAMYQALAAYKEEHGSCNVPRQYKPSPKLSLWVLTQRQFKTKGQLSEERIARLLSIGFEFDPFATRWEAMYQALSAYKEEHGNCDVPSGYKSNLQLGVWCTKQRAMRTKGKLSDDKIARLLSIGFDFDPFTAQWEAMYLALAAYKEEHGSCDVPRQYKPNPQLARWCHKQRTSNNRGALSEERIERMETLGFDFDPKTTAWEEKFQELVEFKAEHRHCDVPRGYPPNPHLATWCSNQRTLNKKGVLSEERIERMETLGFDFDPKTTAWEEKFQELLAYRDEFGHCNVPQSYVANPPLGMWCSTQRTHKNKGALTEDRIARLAAIGFQFDPHTAAWDEKFQELLAYRDEFGHCNVPQSYVANPPLGKWCSAQRNSKKKGKLNEDQIERLELIGFKWKLR